MRITVDYREQPSGIRELLEGPDVIIKVKKIPYGDYCINDAITIERKTARDFLISIIDGRLFRQIANLKKFCPRPLLLIEGNPYKTDRKFDHAAIRGALLSVKAIWQVPVIHSVSQAETAEIILVIGSQECAKAKVIPLRGNYRPKRLKSRQLYILQGLPRVGPKLAKRLLARFRTVTRVMSASETDLMMVEGIGRFGAEAIRKVLDTRAGERD